MSVSVVDSEASHLVVDRVVRVLEARSRVGRGCHLLKALSLGKYIVLFVIDVSAKAFVKKAKNGSLTTASLNQSAEPDSREFALAQSCSPRLFAHRFVCGYLVN